MGILYLIFEKIFINWRYIMDQDNLPTKSESEIVQDNKI